MPLGRDRLAWLLDSEAGDVGSLAEPALTSASASASAGALDFRWPFLMRSGLSLGFRGLAFGSLGISKEVAYCCFTQISTLKKVGGEREGGERGAAATRAMVKKKEKQKKNRNWPGRMAQRRY
jgi:hypothetical protein